MSVDEILAEADGIAVEVLELERRREDLIQQAQDDCKHPVQDLREKNYTPSGLITLVGPPWRVCLTCGLAEEGWGSGYKHLKGDHGSVAILGDKAWNVLVRSKVPQQGERRYL